MPAPDARFWAGRRVLLTGHTGFKGSWLASWLTNMGSEVHGVSLPSPPSEPSLWESLGASGTTESRCDIAGQDWQADALRFEPDVVLHLAAQPLVSVGYREPAATFTSNVEGTVRVMDLLQRLPKLRAAVVVTTDKVYDVRQAPPYDEGSFLGGKDPYAASKAAAELVVHSWPAALPVVTARAGNVIGGGDWAADRLVPDLVRAWSTDQQVVLRMPEAVRPWQHVVEPLAGYLMFAEAVAAGRHVPEALNFGPGERHMVRVADVVEFAAAHWRGLRQGASARWVVEPRDDMPETDVLTLDSRRAEESLGWCGAWSWQDAVAHTLDWYAFALDGADVRTLVLADIGRYLGDVDDTPFAPDHE